jgi:hypothetical protein
MRISQPTWSTFVVVCGALGMALQIAGSAQDKPLPPAYPRPGTTLMLENSRVLVWNIAWLKQQYALHRHPYDLMGVYYAPGDRSIVAVDGSRRPVSTKAWETASQKSGVTHVEEGTSDSPLRAVFVEMKEPSPRDGSPSSSDFAKAGGVQRLDNERATLWEFVPPVSGTHRHLRDAVAVSFTGTTPAASFITAGTVHDSDAPGRPDRVYIVELK